MKVSIIMPAYNAGKYIAEAIESVLAQEHADWELIIINDGSQDNTGDVAQSYHDPRIFYFEQENAGVSRARNNGLARMSGDLFCFLDADDRFTPQSLSARVKIFRENPEVSFVDGVVLQKDSTLDEVKRTYTPNFEGNPFEQIIVYPERCFAFITWMIRRTEQVYRMEENVTHGEDRLFFTRLAADPATRYAYTDEVIYETRLHSQSAINNLKGHEDGYVKLYHIFKDELQVDRKPLRKFKLRQVRVMFLSFLAAGQPFQAIRSGLRILFA